NNLKDKFTERANTLFTSMKDEEEDKNYKIDKKENIKEKIRGLGKTKDIDEIEGELSPLLDNKTKKKYDIATKDKKEIKINRQKEEKDYNKRADLLYPTMKNKEEKEERTEENLDKIDIKKEKETKQKTEQEKLSEKEVKDITKDEATKIYYDYFWKESGASNIKDKKLALMYFDAAINHGPYYAKKYYKESNGNFDDFMELRKNHYKRMAENIPRQKENYNGWVNRLNHLKKFSEEL
ncbi:MAG: hypothetical protein IJY61_06180, partial [Candidatus Gastranaerophilales bacterium]|nr:hypothetical protein [Candidatus Gastranaerophilales bacterium]